MKALHGLSCDLEDDSCACCPRCGNDEDAHLREPDELCEICALDGIIRRANPLSSVVTWGHA